MPEELHLYVVCYDVTSDRIRTRLANDLMNFGARLQGSVFEVRVTHSRFEDLMRMLGAVQLDDDDSIAVYPIHVDAARKIVYFGKEPGLDVPDFFIF